MWGDNLKRNRGIDNNNNNNINYDDNYNENFNNNTKSPTGSHKSVNSNSVHSSNKSSIQKQHINKPNAAKHTRKKRPINLDYLRKLNTIQQDSDDENDEDSDDDYDEDLYKKYNNNDSDIEDTEDTESCYSDPESNNQSDFADDEDDNGNHTDEQQALNKENELFGPEQISNILGFDDTLVKGKHLNKHKTLSRFAYHNVGNTNLESILEQTEPHAISPNKIKSSTRTLPTSFSSKQHDYLFPQIPIPKQYKEKLISPKQTTASSTTKKRVSSTSPVSLSSLTHISSSPIKEIRGSCNDINMNLTSPKSLIKSPTSNQSGKYNNVKMNQQPQQQPIGILNFRDRIEQQNKIKMGDAVINKRRVSFDHSAFNQEKILSNDDESFILSPAQSILKQEQLKSKSPPIQYEEPVIELTQEDMDRRMYISVALIKDAIHYRDPNHLLMMDRLKVYQFYFHPVIRIFLFLVIIVDLVLIYFEYPTNYPIGKYGAQFIELGCVIILCIELGVKRYVYGKPALDNKNNVVKGLFLALNLIDLFVAFILISNGIITDVRISRLLRVYYIIDYDRLTRDLFHQVVYTLFQMLPVSVVFFTYIFLSSVFFSIMFSNGQTTTPGYYDTTLISFLNSMVLVTTCNFPDIMLPAYYTNQWYSLIFIVYLVLGLYLGVNFMIAIVYQSFRKAVLGETKNNFRTRRTALLAAFIILDHDKTGEISLEQWRSMYKEIIPKSTNHEANAAFELVDTDSNGFLNVREFFAMCDVFVTGRKEVQKLAKRRLEREKKRRQPSELKEKRKLEKQKQAGASNDDQQDGDEKQLKYQKELDKQLENQLKLQQDEIEKEEFMKYNEKSHLYPLRKPGDPKTTNDHLPILLNLPQTKKSTIPSPPLNDQATCISIGSSPINSHSIQSPSIKNDNINTPFQRQEIINNEDNFSISQENNQDVNESNFLDDDDEDDDEDMDNEISDVQENEENEVNSNNNTSAIEQLEQVKFEQNENKKDYFDPRLHIHKPHHHHHHGKKKKTKESTKESIEISHSKYAYGFLLNYNYKIITKHWAFEIFVSALLYFNAIIITLVMVHYRSLYVPRWTLITDDLLLGISIAEVILKLFANGRRFIFWISFNVSIVTVSLIGKVVFEYGLRPYTENSITLLRVACVFRFIRLLRLLSSTRKMRHFMQSLAQLVFIFLNFIGIILVIYYIYAVIGIWAYKGKFYEGNPKLIGTDYDALNYYGFANFNTFAAAIVTLFYLMVLNNWYITFFAAIDITSSWSILYFCSFYFISIICVLNLVVAFLIEAVNYTNNFYYTKKKKHTNQSLHKFKKQFKVAGHDENGHLVINGFRSGENIKDNNIDNHDEAEQNYDFGIDDDHKDGNDEDNNHDSGDSNDSDSSGGNDKGGGGGTDIQKSNDTNHSDDSDGMESVKSLKEILDMRQVSPKKSKKKISPQSIKRNFAGTPRIESSLPTSEETSKPHDYLIEQLEDLKDNYNSGGLLPQSNNEHTGNNEDIYPSSSSQGSAFDKIPSSNPLVTTDVIDLIRNEYQHQRKQSLRIQSLKQESDLTIAPKSDSPTFRSNLAKSHPIPSLKTNHNDSINNNNNFIPTTPLSKSQSIHSPLIKSKSPFESLPSLSNGSKTINATTTITTTSTSNSDKNNDKSEIRKSLNQLNNQTRSNSKRDLLHSKKNKLEEKIRKLELEIERHNKGDLKSSTDESTDFEPPKYQRKKSGIMSKLNHRRNSIIGISNNNMKINSKISSNNNKNSNQSKLDKGNIGGIGPKRRLSTSTDHLRSISHVRDSTTDDTTTSTTNNETEDDDNDDDEIKKIRKKKDNQAHNAHDLESKMFGSELKDVNMEDINFDQFLEDNVLTAVTGQQLPITQPTQSNSSSSPNTSGDNNKKKNK